MTRAHLMTFFRNNLITVALLSICSCTSGPIPKWDGKLWAGKSKYAGILFTKKDGTNVIIPANDPRFDDYVAMSYADFRSFMATYVYGCKQWKSGVAMMNAQQAQARFQLILDEWAAEVQQ
jgi:hypothetical protein